MMSSQCSHVSFVALSDPGHNADESSAIPHGMRGNVEAPCGSHNAPPRETLVAFRGFLGEAARGGLTQPCSLLFSASRGSRVRHGTGKTFWPTRSNRKEKTPTQVVSPVDVALVYPRNTREEFAPFILHH